MAASRRVVIGADTHRDTNHLAVLTDAGKPLADAEFPTSPTGYDDALRWARSFGTVAIAGVEGTSSYGAGLTRVLQAAGIEVAEVSRPDRAARRRQGKSDPLDAYAAARSAVAGHGLAVPKDAHTSALRALLTARRSAVKAHTAATTKFTPCWSPPRPSYANATAATAPPLWSKHWLDADPPPTATPPPSQS